MDRIELRYVSGYYVDKLHISAKEHIIKRTPFFIFRASDNVKLIAVPAFGNSGYGHGEASHSTVKIDFYDLDLNKVEVEDYTSLYIQQT
tara:strand:- start:1424 stop:1690 length:267 start_codon:yes stop_codon:yes gene_type:complete